MSRVLVDTSVFIEAERRNLQALERVKELLEQEAISVSVVTAVELLASATLAADLRRFYATLFATEAEVLPLSLSAADEGIRAARAAGGGSAPDILIAGTALERGLRVVTCDADLARLVGPSRAELLRAS